MKWFDIADELLPPIYRAIKDMYAYAKAVNGELLAWVSYMERMLNNFYIQNCDSSTLSYWEELLNIHTSGESNDARREKILTLLNNSTPTTESYVRGVIEKTFPGEEYHLWFDVENGNDYDLNIDIFTMDDSKINEFRNWFNKMCPAHLKQIVARAEKTSFDRELFVNCANLSSMFYSLGVVSFIEPPPPPPIEAFGEIIKAYLTDEGAANTSTMQISATDRPLYDASGSPLLFESGYKYDIVGVGNNGIDGDASLNAVSPGEQMAVSASYNFRVSSNIVFVFKVASDEDFSIYPFTSGYSIQGTVTIAAGGLGVLYGMGSGNLVSYRTIAGKVLRDVVSGTGERLGTDGFVIEENANGYANLRNNRAEAVRIARVIFSN